ncbi:MAG: ACT domain-containing protein [Deltaproteobacteria bacterium]|uniref:ACT domain-containing protein n=1 Tax=Candidatus Zymogenus saltonus TaxID=2844893 RepID=A0A9D8KDB4_9DELT|nr:ACT domain-containing protein [Candidatus Zymogenus saltonus]
MRIKQISVVLENIPGKLSEISDVLGGEGINIRAITVADTSDLTTIRMVVDDPKKAILVLEGMDYKVRQRDVLAVETPDHPGGLNAVLKPLKEANINVHYLYPYIGRIGDNAILIVGVDKLDEAIDVMKRNWVHLISENKLSSL